MSSDGPFRMRVQQRLGIAGQRRSRRLRQLFQRQHVNGGLTHRQVRHHRPGRTPRRHHRAAASRAAPDGAQRRLEIKWFWQRGSPQAEVRRAASSWHTARPSGGRPTPSPHSSPAPSPLLRERAGVRGTTPLRDCPAPSTHRGRGLEPAPYAIRGVRGRPFVIPAEAGI